jgi:hypothetical protein
VRRLAAGLTAFDNSRRPGIHSPESASVQRRGVGLSRSSSASTSKVRAICPNTPTAEDTFPWTLKTSPIITCRAAHRRFGKIFEQHFRHA